MLHRPTLSLALLVAFAAPVAAQDPGAAGPEVGLGTAFSFQGSLTDDGAPADRAFDFRFALYDRATGGQQVGATVARNNVAVEAGQFAVDLDFGPVFDGRALWLEIAVSPRLRNQFETLTPRTALTATPYALALPDRAVTGPMLGDGAVVGGANVTVSRTASGALEIAASGTSGGLALPYAGSASTSNVGFSVENTGPGLAGRFTGAGQAALFVRGVGTQAPTDALNVSATGTGVRVDADADGLMVLGAGDSGAGTASSSHNGLEVRGAEGAGVFVGSAGTAGVNVWASGTHGVIVRQAGAPSSPAAYSGLPSGLEVVRAEGHGLFVGAADADGVHVEAAGGRAGYFGGDVDVAGGLDVAGRLDLGGPLACAGCVDGSDVADGALTGADLQDGTVTGLDVQDGSITGADLQDGTVRSADVADGSLTGDDIADGSLTNADFGGTFGTLAGGAGVGGKHFPRVAIPRDYAITVRELTLDLPSSGLLLTWASAGVAALDSDGPSSNDPWVYCAISTGTSLPDNPETSREYAIQLHYETFGENNYHNVMSLTDYFVVDGPGALTVRLLCREYDDDIEVSQSHLTALFVPNQY